LHDHLIDTPERIVAKQRQFFHNGASKKIAFRREALNSLKKAIIRNEQEILTALKDDMKKPLLESYASEIGLIIKEINFALKNLGKWAKKKRVKSTLLLFPSKSIILCEPYGVALIIGPWNYPFYLTFTPLVGAIAAGNCCVVKPSEISPASSTVIRKLIEETFSGEYIKAVEGDAETAKSLSEKKFDKIFFSGSSAVGKIVMQQAAKHLTSITLELGGKSPCIVDKGVNAYLTAKRILWGKFFNVGQTCIAPDYVMVHKDIKKALYVSFSKCLETFYGTDPEKSPDLGRIIDEKHFNRLQNYLNDGTVIAGGELDQEKLFISPTILEVTDTRTPVMQEEIFGPILPVIEFSRLEEVEDAVALNPEPLAFYLFSTDRGTVDRLIGNIPFGGGCINDTFSHFINHNLPFGGRGQSGIGNYHGRYSFDAFSHQKSLLVKGFRFDFGVKYPPYRDKHIFLRKLFLR